LLNGKLTAHRREGTCNEISRTGKSVRAKLGRRVVSPVKKVVDPEKELNIPAHLVLGTQVDDRISRRSSGAQIISAVGLMLIVLVAACAK
jgi:hypothetical protein